MGVDDRPVAELECVLLSGAYRCSEAARCAHFTVAAIQLFIKKATNAVSYHAHKDSDRAIQATGDLASAGSVGVFTWFGSSVSHLLTFRSGSQR